MKQREIKFRAWDKKAKKFMFWDEVQKEHFNGVYDNNFEFQQYTGIKDKNGKELYEGDFVINPFYAKADPVIYEIKWEFMGFDCYSIKHNYLDNREVRQHPFGFKNSGEVEIIGNIYENSELLNEKKTAKS